MYTKQSLAIDVRESGAEKHRKRAICAIHTAAEELNNKFGRPVRAIRCDIVDAASVDQFLHIDRGEVMS